MSTAVRPSVVDAPTTSPPSSADAMPAVVDSRERSQCDSIPESYVNLSSTHRTKTSTPAVHPNPLAASTTTTPTNSSAAPSTRRRRQSYQPSTLYGESAPNADGGLAESQISDATGAVPSVTSPPPQSASSSAIATDSPWRCTRAAFSGAHDGPAAHDRRRSGSLLAKDSPAAQSLAHVPRRAAPVTRLPETEELQDWKDAAQRLLKQWEMEKTVSGAYRREFGSLRSSAQKLSQAGAAATTPPHTPLTTPPQVSLATDKSTPPPAPVSTSSPVPDSSASFLASAPHAVDSLQVELHQSQELQKELRALLVERDETIRALQAELAAAKAEAAALSEQQQQQQQLQRLSISARDSLTTSPPHPPPPSQLSGKDGSLSSNSARGAAVRRISLLVSGAASERNSNGTPTTGSAMLVAGAADDTAGAGASATGASPLSTHVMSPSPPPSSPNAGRLELNASFRRVNNRNSAEQQQQQQQQLHQSTHQLFSIMSSGSRLPATPTSLAVSGVGVPPSRDGGHTAEESAAHLLPSLDSPSLFTTSSSMALPHVLGVNGAVATATGASGRRGNGSDDGLAATLGLTAPSHTLTHPFFAHASATGAASVGSLSNSPSVSSFTTPTLGTIGHGVTRDGAVVRSQGVAKAASAAPHSPLFTRPHRGLAPKPKPSPSAASSSSVAPVSAPEIAPGHATTHVPQATTACGVLRHTAAASVPRNLSCAVSSASTTAGDASEGEALPLLAVESLSTLHPSRPTSGGKRPSTSLTTSTTAASSTSGQNVDPLAVRSVGRRLSATGAATARALQKKEESPPPPPPPQEPEHGANSAPPSQSPRPQPQPPAPPSTATATSDNDAKKGTSVEPSAAAPAVDPCEELRRWRREAARAKHQ